MPPPADPDANGVFTNGGGSTIANNHEIGGSDAFGVPALAGLTYDPGARGDTTNIDLDAIGSRLTEYTSVAATHSNCAQARRDANSQMDHGYVFELDPTSQIANVGKSPCRWSSADGSPTGRSPWTPTPT